MTDLGVRDRPARKADAYVELCQIRGVGRYIAMLVIAEIGDISRFPSARHLCAGAGLTPTVRSSDGLDRFRPPPGRRTTRDAQPPEARDRPVGKARPFMDDTALLQRETMCASAIRGTRDACTSYTQAVWTHVPWTPPFTRFG
jgi:Transposase IS116/IS110/IS902 family